MELLKKNIHMSRRKGQFVSQLNLDEDQNVPDSKADVERIIQEKSEVLVEEVRPAKDHVMVRGALVYDLLYMDNEKEHRIHCLRGKIFFEEAVHVDDISDRDNVCVEWEYEAPHVTIINSRKINFRTLLTISVTVEEIYDEEVAVALAKGDGVQKRCKEIPLLQMRVSKKDILRVRNQWQLPSDKTNIREVLFYQITPKGVHIVPAENQLQVSGELLVFLLYASEGENPIPKWLEYSIHFQETVECSGAQEDMVGDIHWELGSKELEIKPDSDGEERVVAVECVLELSVKLYQEETVDTMADVYATDRQLIAETRLVPFSRLLVKNESQCRTNKVMKVTDAQSRVLQICHVEGTVKTEHTEIVENGIKIDGSLYVKLLYITADDGQPFRLAKGTIPFSHVVETKGITESCSYHVYPVLEQLSANMVDSEELEIKAIINMNTIVFEKQPEVVIQSIREEPLDMEAIQELPGMVGYCVQEGEELWSIAKRYYTTIQSLMEINELSEEQVKPGQQLVILKTVMPVTS